MPLAAEKLTPNSSDAEVQAAISASIEACMKEGGRPQDQCVAMAYSMARKATGHGSGSKGTSMIAAGLSEQSK